MGLKKKMPILALLFLTATLAINADSGVETGQVPAAILARQEKEGAQSNAAAQPQASPSAERGKKALLTRAFTPGLLSEKAYANAWKFWDGPLQQSPENYDAAFRDHYGLHAAPYENGRFPMGLRQAPGLLGGTGLATDCMLCHGGSILGKSYVGLGNSSLDLQALLGDLTGSGNARLPFALSRVRGTTEAIAATGFLYSFREPDLKLRFSPRDVGSIRDELIERTPAWWLLKKKKTMYHTGDGHARSVRALMQPMLGSPLNTVAVFEREEPTFRDIHAYLLTLEAPKYPYPIDRDLARTGEGLFSKHCAKCHGTYGPNGSYPNKIVPIDEIGTDRTRFEGIPQKFADHYITSWFGQEPGLSPIAKSVGYQAPPLDGVWATAPYLHNGSVPTLYHVLNSAARPRIFTRSYRTDAEAFDNVNIGWKVKVLDQAPTDLSPFERRRIYDTTRPGQGNGGHIFGDHLSEEQRRAVIEFLKTL